MPTDGNGVLLNVSTSSSLDETRREIVFSHIEAEARAIVQELLSVNPQDHREWLATRVSQFVPRVHGQPQINVAFTLGMCVGNKLHELVSGEE